MCDAGRRAGAAIKWPNDVVLVQPGGSGLAKLAGILLEGRPREGWAVLGIGVNVAVRLEELPPELRAGTDASRAQRGLPAASLGLSAEAIEPLLARLLQALERRLAQDPEETLQAWRARDALAGREIAWSRGSGRAEGIDGDGRLIVALAAGGHTTIGAGEVHLERIG